MSASFYDIMRYAKTGIASSDMTAYDKMRALAMAGGAVKTLTGVPPLSFRANGKPLISWSMLGNSQQDGTPAPDAPIMPEFVGVRTANVMPAGEKKTITSNGITVESDGYGRYHVYGTSTDKVSVKFSLISGFTIPISISNGGQGTLSFFNTQENQGVRFVFYNGSTEVDDWGLMPMNRTHTSYKIIGNKYVDSVEITVSSRNNVDMIISPEFTNDGVLPTEFEHYGWKIPVTSAGQTVPVYLGQTPTVRRIKKLVFDGTENWQVQKSQWRNDTALFALQQNRAQIGKMNNRLSVNTHFISVAAGVNPQGQNYVCSGYHPADDFSNFYYIRPDFTTIGITSETTGSDAITAFNSWLAQQHAAGTPVVIWYVLATPTTGIVNEPLCKIDTYADTLDSTDAGVSIPTARGQNTLTVDTELQPSSMTITYR